MTSGPGATKYEPGVRVSEYILEKHLGGGTFGEVWQARHHIWRDDRVAVKLPTEPQYVRYLQQEGVVVHGLRHPNIIRVIGLDPYAEIPYLVMELVNGPSLRQVINERPEGLPVSVTMRILRGLLNAVATAHAANIIHRDLKPGNVLLNLGERPVSSVTEDDVKVGDFGLGVNNEDALRSMVQQSASIQRGEESAAIAGTLAYMAPEVRDGQRDAGPQSDLYSIGVILFEMLTGERPAGAELPSTLRADVPQEIDNVFRKLYARLELRYLSASAVMSDLVARSAPPPPPVEVPTAAAGGLRICPGCAESLGAEDQFCTHCGRQLARTIRRCGRCGGFPAREDHFCIHCGAALPVLQE